MKLGPWRFRTHKATATASQLVPALDRVREMREHSAWEAVTSAAIIQQRSDRILEARQHIVIPRLANERDHRLMPPERFSLVRVLVATMVAILGYFAIVLVWLIFFAED